MCVNKQWRATALHEGPPAESALPVEAARLCSRRYGFVVYADASVTDVACAGLNGMRMGERTLTVRRATEVRGRVEPLRADALCPRAVS